MKDKRHIYLIGFSGCGKSTIGPLLAKRLKLKFYDTDQEIEKNAGKTIPQIFKDFGQNAFRKMETGVLSQVSQKKSQAVIALGGGALVKKENLDIIAKSGCLIYLSCAARELNRRLKDKEDRPLLNNRERKATSRIERIKRLLATRIERYRRADLTISTSTRTPREAVSLITTKLKSI